MSLKVLGVDGAGVSLANDQDDLQFVTASDASVAWAEHHQTALGEGPCHDAYRSGEQVSSTDLRADQRWPALRKIVLDQGFHSMAGIPMPIDERRIGALDLYRVAPGPWADDDLDTAQLLADMASGYVLNAQRLEHKQRVADQLQHALDSRVVVEQAKGILAERHDIPVEQAFTLLRQHARSNRLKLHDVCRQVIAGTLKI